MRRTVTFAPEIKPLLREVGQIAAEHGSEAWAVGGVVRDALAEHANKDLDVAVDGDVAPIADRLASKWSAGVTTHGAFGTATIEREDGTRVDLAQTRTETYSRPGA